MKKVKLGEVVTLKKGKKATILNEQTTLSQRYIQIDDLRNDNNLKFTESLNMTEALLDDILIAWDGANAGTIGYGLSGAVGSTIMVLKKNEQYKDEIISDYLGVFLESKSQYLRYHSTGATIPHLNKNILLDLKLELLHIEEQENIICILNIIKRLITKRKCQLEELNLLVKSRFNEMFGDPILNDMGWQVTKLGELTNKISSGNTPKGGSQVYVDKGIMFFRSQNVWKNKILLDDIAYIDDQTNRNMKDTILEHGDLLITKTGRVNTENSSLGRTAQYLGQSGKANINGHVYLVRINSDISKRFILEILISNAYRDYIRRICVGGIDKRQLNKNHIEDFPIILPPLSLQNEFADFVAQVDKSQLAIQKSLEELETLKKSLMQEYFG